MGAGGGGGGREAHETGAWGVRCIRPPAPLLDRRPPRARRRGLPPRLLAGGLPHAPWGRRLRTLASTQRPLCGCAHPPPPHPPFSPEPVHRHRRQERRTHERAGICQKLSVTDKLGAIANATLAAENATPFALPLEAKESAQYAVASKLYSLPNFTQAVNFVQIPERGIALGNFTVTLRGV